jgi:hypothetical protein
MNAEGIQGFREVPAVRRVERRDSDEHPQQEKDREPPEGHEEKHMAEPAVEDLIDHDHEPPDDAEPVVLDEELPADDEHDLDVLL